MMKHAPKWIRTRNLWSEVRHATSGLLGHVQMLSYFIVHLNLDFFLSRWHNETYLPLISGHLYCSCGTCCYLSCKGLSDQGTSHNVGILLLIYFECLENVLNMTNTCFSTFSLQHMNIHARFENFPLWNTKPSTLRWLEHFSHKKTATFSSQRRREWFPYWKFHSEMTQDLHVYQKLEAPSNAHGHDPGKSFCQIKSNISAFIVAKTDKWCLPIMPRAQIGVLWHCIEAMYFISCSRVMWSTYA